MQGCVLYHHFALRSEREIGMVICTSIMHDRNEMIRAILSNGVHVHLQFYTEVL